MKKYLLFIAIALIAFSLSAHIVETGSMEKFLIGSEPACQYDNWISHIAEGIAIQDYNLYAPYDRQTNGFGNYRTPTNSQLNQWGNIVDLFLLGELDQAQAAITQAGFPYQAVEFHNTDNNRTYYMLRELPDMSYYDDNGTPDDPYDDEDGAFDYAWGLYIYSPDATRPIIVTAPHPNDDFPTPIVSYDCFNEWDAMFLLISGTGREVKWTNIGSYTNTKSLSDPTRVTSHPFNSAYTRFADLIRSQTGKREFSFQVHSYDWDRHVGYTDNQISAGNNKLCPNLPIRDLSSLKKDLIHKGNHLMIPANTYGTHEDVYLNQYYSVNYSIHDFIFDDGEHSYPVNDAIDLPAYSQNYQMLYTLSSWNDYDSFEPFFHIEMDELPNAYDETLNVYHWFYGWNEAEGKWDFDNLFTNVRAYYSRWRNDLNELYDDLFAMDDGVPPTTPEELTIKNSSMYYVTLGWQRSDAYDFETYEIQYATQPITEDNYQTFTRANNAMLASQACERINVTGLSNNQNYYFKIRALDKNGNYSGFSNEVTTTPAPANISSFSAHGMPGSVCIHWSLANQGTTVTGYNINRRADNGAYEVIASYLDDPSLLPGTGSYEYWDFMVEDGVQYTYTVSMIRNDGFEFVHNDPQKACLGPMVDLIFSTVSGSHTDTLTLGSNRYATDERDDYWDTTKGSPGSNYVWIASWQPYWGNNGTSLSREMRAEYDVDNSMKTWTLRVRSDRLNLPLQIEADRQNLRGSEKLYIYDGGTWHDLYDSPYQFSVNSSSIRTMTLYWGNLQPAVSHVLMDNRVYQGGEAIHFGFNFQNSFLIDNFSLYIKNETDSLSILENVPPNISSYSYILPQVIDMPKSKVMIQINAADGQVNTHPSPHTLALVPKTNLFYFDPGWATVSNPYTNAGLCIEEVFGSGALGYAWEAGQWLEENGFTFNTPLFINGTDYLFTSTSAGVLRDQISLPLQPGWNLVANPHFCIYDIKSLRYFVNGKAYKFSEIIDQKLVSRAIYVYREGSYHLVNEIQPYESFYICSYAPAEVNLELNFFPYYEAPSITPPAPYWTVKVTAEGIDKDSFSFGASPLGSDNIDFRVDMPKAPEKELFDGIACYLEPLDDEGTPLFVLQEEYRADFSGSGEQFMRFHFTLEVPDDSPVDFSFDTQNVPSDWILRFVMDGEPLHISDTAVYHYQPSEAGTYFGFIDVFNYPVSNVNVVQPAFSGLKVYPNPFNPSTTIMFHNPSAQNLKVDIYNLRGQKVCNLYDGMLGAGTQNLVWHGKDARGRAVASGVYFARVKGKNKAQTIKMMLMK